MGGVQPAASGDVHRQARPALVEMGHAPERQQETAGQTLP
jgi:hypothetical protein